jgi:hypothetical protein
VNVYVTDPEGTLSILTVTSTGIDYDAGLSGTYSYYAIQSNGCSSSTFGNGTLTVGCNYNPTFTLSGSTTTWEHNKFPKFTLSPTIAGLSKCLCENSNFL